MNAAISQWMHANEFQNQCNSLWTNMNHECWVKLVNYQPTAMFQAPKHPQIRQFLELKMKEQNMVYSTHVQENHVDYLIDIHQSFRVIREK